MEQLQDVHMQSPPHLQVQQQHQEPVQARAHPLGQHSHVPDYLHEDNRLDILGTHINQESSVNTSPYTHYHDTSIHQQVPGPDHSSSLRRSARTERGETSRYDDFVQTISQFAHRLRYCQITTITSNQT